MEFKKLDIACAVESTLGEVGSEITENNFIKLVDKLHIMINKHIEYEIKTLAKMKGLTI